MDHQFLSLILTARIFRSIKIQKRQNYTNSSDEFSTSTNRSHYYRAFSLSIIDIIVMLPIGVGSIIADYSGQPLDFWPGWGFIHGTWRPIHEPKNDWDRFFWTVFSLQADKWLYPCLGMIFFSIFGLTSHARSRYKEFTMKVLESVGIRRTGRYLASTIVFESNNVENSC